MLHPFVWVWHFLVFLLMEPCFHGLLHLGGPGWGLAGVRGVLGPAHTGSTFSESIPCQMYCTMEITNC